MFQVVWNAERFDFVHRKLWTLWSNGCKYILYVILVKLHQTKALRFFLQLKKLTAETMKHVCKSSLNAAKILPKNTLQINSFVFSIWSGNNWENIIHTSIINQSYPSYTMMCDFKESSLQNHCFSHSARVGPEKWPKVPHPNVFTVQQQTSRSLCSECNREEKPPSPSQVLFQTPRM